MTKELYGYGGEKISLEELQEEARRMHHARCTNARSATKANNHGDQHLHQPEDDNPPPQK